jgi:hypothetical protein
MKNFHVKMYFKCIFSVKFKIVQKNNFCENKAWEEELRGWRRKKTRGFCWSKNVHIRPDPTKKQWQEEGNMADKAKTRNKEELIQEEKTKKLNIGGGGCKGRKKADKERIQPGHPGRQERDSTTGERSWY